MSEFKIGDRVEVGSSSIFRVLHGALGDVVGFRDGWPRVRFDSGYQATFNPEDLFMRRSATGDNINHPQHYKQLPVEVIEITKHFDFLLGNVLKYVLRHEHKGKPLEDLKKARWYLDRAITEREGEL